MQYEMQQLPRASSLYIIRAQQQSQLLLVPLITLFGSFSSPNLSSSSSSSSSPLFFYCFLFMTFPQRSCSLPVVEHPPIRSSSLATPSTSNTTTTTTTTTTTNSTNDTDEAISLLEWKRMSILRTLDWSNVLVPTDLWTSSQLFPDINQKDECQETADRLWDGDLSVIEPTSMASFLGRS